MSKSNNQKDRRPEYQEVNMMNHKALMRAVVSRGLDFQLAIDYDDLQKANWFINNYYDTHPNPKLIDEFDEYRHQVFLANGRTPKKEPWYFDARTNYGFVGEVNEDTGKTKERRIKGFKKKLVLKKEKDKSFNIFKGTKKSLTYDCCVRDIPIDETIDIVTKSFPEALEKSIRIWYSRAKKEAKRLKSMQPGIEKNWEKPLELPIKKKLVLKKPEEPKKKLVLKKKPKLKLKR